MNFPLRTSFPASHKLWYVVFPFSFVSKYFLILFWFPFWPFGCSGTYCLIFMFVNFQVFFLQLISSFISCDQKRWKIYLIWFQYFKIYLPVLWPNTQFIMDRTWEKCLFYCFWVDWFVYVCWVHLVYSVIQVCCFLINFLSG